MKFDDLFKLAKKLSSSQGFYSRLLERLKELDEDEQAYITKEMRKNGLKDELDIILWLEG